MSYRPNFEFLRYLANALIVLSLIGLCYGLLQEYSMRAYLQGFSDAVTPDVATNEQKVEAILAYIKEEQLGVPTHYAGFMADRDPRITLNHSQLLRYCGTATNAFVNLAHSSGLEARRLLLLGPNSRAKHVVAEVKLKGRWVVVDPTYHALLRDASGHLLTRSQLRDPAVLREATRNIVGYDPSFTYERTLHVRLIGIPLVGGVLTRALNFVYPGWDRSPTLDLVLERESMLLVLIFAFAVVISLLARLALSFLGFHYLNRIPRSQRQELRT